MASHTEQTEESPRLDAGGNKFLNDVEDLTFETAHEADGDDGLARNYSDPILDDIRSRNCDGTEVLSKKFNTMSRKTCKHRMQVSQRVYSNGSAHTAPQDFFFQVAPSMDISGLITSISQQSSDATRERTETNMSEELGEMVLDSENGVLVHKQDPLQRQSSMMSDLANVSMDSLVPPSRSRTISKDKELSGPRSSRRWPLPFIGKEKGSITESLVEVRNSYTVRAGTAKLTRCVMTSADELFRIDNSATKSLKDTPHNEG